MDSEPLFCVRCLERCERYIEYHTDILNDLCGQPNWGHWYLRPPMKIRNLPCGCVFTSQSQEIINERKHVITLAEYNADKRVNDQLELEGEK